MATILGIFLLGICVWVYAAMNYATPKIEYERPKFWWVPGAIGVLCIFITYLRLA